jgi:Tol biopolymer transport system component
VSIVEGIRRGGLQSGAPGAAQFDYSRNGTLVYLPGPANPATGGDWDLALFDTNGNAQPLKLPPAPYRTPRASPDGKSIAVATDDGREEVIWVYDVTGRSPLRRLTFGGKNRLPVWSPDGQWIAFQSNREGDVAIFRQRADGSSGIPERLTKPDAGTTHSPLAWSPDGTHLLVTVYESRSDRWKNGQFTLWMMSVGDRLMRPFGNVRSADQIEAAFSPDGRWVAYQSREPGITPSQVYLQPFPGAETKYLVPQAGANPFWLARRGLLILAQQSESFAIPVATAPRVIFGRPTTFPRGSRFEGPVGSGPRWVDAMPDGEHVIGVLSVTNASDSANASQVIVVLNWSEELKQRVPTK